MSRWRLKVLVILLFTAALACAGAPAFAQGGATTASLSGTVVDSSGGVIPGADVVAKEKNTGMEVRAVTGSAGKFEIPGMPPGAYTVTISLMGFKTIVLPDVQVLTATATQVKNIVLEVGRLEETVLVQGSTEIVQTQTASVTSTLTTAQINSTPLPTRSTMDFVAMLPGVNTTTTLRGSTVMGLAGNATNITIDGLNTQDNYLKSSDGFFSRISPRLDAVEEVTVSSANPGAESAGQGAVQIRFQTRQGTNQFQGSVYEYNRNTAYNSNSWFNKRDGLPKDIQNINTYGFRVGGPIVIPHLFDGHDKAFFFFNYEEWRPGESTTSRSRNVLTQDSMNGKFYYGKVNSANPLGSSAVDIWSLVDKVNAALAGKTYNGQVWTPLPSRAQADPTIAKNMAAIVQAEQQGQLAAATTAGFNTLSWAAPSSQDREYPTARVDVNLTPRNRVGMSFYWQRYYSFPDALNNYDPTFPGFPGANGQYSERWSWMANWRSTVNSTIVNEVRGGMTGGPVQFGWQNSKDVFNDPNVPMNGWAINYAGLMTSPYRGTASNQRDAPTRVLEDTLSLIKGKHSVSAGASFTQVLLNWPYQYFANTLSFGMPQGDPALNVFSSSAASVWGQSFSASMPGATTTEVSNAQALYALLTGRVSSVGYTAYLQPDGTYAVNGSNNYQAHENEMGLYVQDGWKLKPNLTLNYGLRWEMQFPFVADNASFGALQDPTMIYGRSGVPTSSAANGIFTPGVVNGAVPQVVGFAQGGQAYHMPWTNIAPSLGVAWRPSLEGKGVLQKVLSADPVLRGGYSRAYLREGMAYFSGLYRYNPGGSYDANRNTGKGNLTPGTAFFNNPSSIPGPDAFPDKPAYPITPQYSDSLNGFLPDTKTPYVDSWNIGLQRTLDRNTAIEVRYVGNRGHNTWYSSGGRNYNGEPDILHQPGGAFVDEFKQAQANLQANIAAGRGSNFKYYGPGTGTGPLPILMAFFQGKAPASGAANTPSNYSASNWSSSTYYNQMGLANPNAINLASLLQSNATTRCNAYGPVGAGASCSNGTSAGLPLNFFYMAPDTGSGGAYVTGGPNDYRQSSYDAAQVEVRRRLSNGLQISGSYQRVFENKNSSFYSLFWGADQAYTGVPTHSFKMNWVYELPFGQGKTFGNGVSRGMNRLIGGWSVDGNLRWQSGNRLDFGNVRLVGMTDQDLQDMFYLRMVPDTQGKTRIYFLPQDVIDNSILAWSNDPLSSTGYSGASPQGRYIARNNGTSCVPTYAGDTCGTSNRHHYVWGPQFFRVDASLAKRMNITSRVYMDFRWDVMNVFENVNFFAVTMNSNYSAFNQLAAFESNSAYKDSNGTNDPGGRIMQFSLRVSW